LDNFLKNGLARERQVLGHLWVVPEKAIPYPLTWPEGAQAPWPWQVQQALSQLYACLAPDDLAKAAAWLDEALKLPWGTDSEALTFVHLANHSHHLKTLAVMARWRSIALDSSKPNAARDVAVFLSEAISL